MRVSCFKVNKQTIYLAMLSEFLLSTYCDELSYYWFAVCLFAYSEWKRERHLCPGVLSVIKKWKIRLKQDPTCHKATQRFMSESACEKQSEREMAGEFCYWYFVISVGE